MKIRSLSELPYSRFLSALTKILIVYCVALESGAMRLMEATCWIED